MCRALPRLQGGRCWDIVWPPACPEPQAIILHSAWARSPSGLLSTGSGTPHQGRHGPGREGLATTGVLEHVPSGPAQALAAGRAPSCQRQPHQALLPMPLGRFSFLGRGSLKDVPHPRCLLLKELGVLRALLAPGRVKGRGVLVHQVCVLCPPRAPKVLDLGSRRTCEQLFRGGCRTCCSPCPELPPLGIWAGHPPPAHPPA